MAEQCFFYHHFHSNAHEVLRTCCGKPSFNSATNKIVGGLCKAYHLRTRYDRPRAAAKPTSKELAAQL